MTLGKTQILHQDNTNVSFFILFIFIPFCVNINRWQIIHLMDIAHTLIYREVSYFKDMYAISKK